MNGYALGDALAGGRETGEWWQDEVTRMVADLWDRNIEVTHQVQKMARSSRRGSAATLLRKMTDSKFFRPEEEQ